jgi:hypothetical protein
MLLADSGYAKIYAEFLQETAERIDLAGYDVSAMTSYEEGQFCGVIHDTKISSDFDVIYGLPYPFWTRENSLKLRLPKLKAAAVLANVSRATWLMTIRIS